MTHPLNLFRPVLSSLPIHKQLLEDSNIPCSVVLCPFARITTKETPVLQEKDCIPAGAIARCKSCGATVNPCSQLLSDNRFRCGLCGEVNDFMVLLRDRMVSNEGLEDKCSLAEFEEVEFEKRYLFTRENQSLVDRAFSFGGGKACHSREDLPEMNEHLIEFDCNVLPNEMNSAGQFVKSVHAKDCPPLMIALIDIDVDDVNDNNIAAVCTSLRNALKSAPSFVRFGIFLYYKDHLGVFDLTCRFPHLKHMSLKSTSSLNQPRLTDFISVYQAFPSLEEARINVESALRALGDYKNSLLPTFRAAEDMTKNENRPIEDEAPLQLALNAIHDFMEETDSSHPGMALFESLNQGKKDRNTKTLKSVLPQHLFYMGGKIMTFITSKPVHSLSQPTVDVLISESIGRGGFGGSCRKVDCKHAIDNFKNDRVNGYSMRNSGHGDEYSPWDLSDHTENDKAYSLIGKRSAKLALSIEIFCLTCHDKIIPFPFNIPAIKPLSDRSGGSGPIIVNTADHNIDNIFSYDEILNGEGGTVAGLVKSVLCRSPWYR